MDSKKWRIGLGLVLVVFLLGLMAACGSDEPANQETESPPPSEETNGEETHGNDENGNDGNGETATEDVELPDQIRFIVPTSAGGGMDLQTRIIGQYWEEVLGIPVNVENLPGANYNNGIYPFLREEPGSSAILMPGANLNQLTSSVDYDMTEWTWLGTASAATLIGVASTDSGITSFEDLVEHSHITAGSMGLGSGTTVGQLVSAREFGFDVTPITHAGGTEAALSAVRGDADWVTTTPAILLPFIEDGDVIPLYTTASERLEELPDVPTLAELGFETLANTVNVYRIVAVHPDTDPALAELLHDTFAEAVQVSGFLADTTEAGMDPLYMTGEETVQYVQNFLNLMEPNIDYLQSFD